MPPRGRKAHLEDSWVVEGEDGSGSGNESLESSPGRTYSPPKAIHSASTRSGKRSPEPELVMPSLDSQTLEASWADMSRRSTRFRKGTRPAENHTRRRTFAGVEDNGRSLEASPKAQRQIDKVSAKSDLNYTAQSASK